MQFYFEEYLLEAMITDAAVAVTSGSDVNKWMGPLKEMLTLAPGVFGAEQHTSSLRDIASSVLAFLQSPHTLDKANTGWPSLSPSLYRNSFVRVHAAILFTCLQRSFSNSRLHPQFCTERVSRAPCTRNHARNEPVSLCRIWISFLKYCLVVTILTSAAPRWRA